MPYHLLGNPSYEFLSNVNILKDLLNFLNEEQGHVFHEVPASQDLPEPEQIPANEIEQLPVPLFTLLSLPMVCYGPGQALLSLELD